MQCTLFTELVDCPYPKGCFVVRNASGIATSSSCECLSTFGYVGNECTTITTSFQLYTAWWCIVLILTCILFVWGCFSLFPTIFKSLREKSFSPLAFTSSITLAGTGIHIIYLSVIVASIFSAAADVDPSGRFRVTRYWHTSFVILFLDVFILVLTVVFMSALWVETAYRSIHLKKMNKAREMRIRYFAFGISASILIVTFCLFALAGLTQSLLFLSIVLFLTVALWLFGAIFIFRVIAQVAGSSDNNVYGRALRLIRFYSLLVSLFMFLVATGAALQLARSGVPGHDQQLWEVPQFVIGTGLAITSIMVTYGLLLHYSQLRASDASEHSSSRSPGPTSSVNHKNGALSTVPTPSVAPE